jgi:FemAB-related protein (PEP-CTERM system-associated)
MDIVFCGAQERAEWDSYVESSPAATVCHPFLWQLVIGRAYGHRPFYLLARQNGRVRGILPLFLVKSRLFGKSLASMPFLDYGGVCADDEATGRLLLERAMELLGDHGADYLEIRQSVSPAGGGLLRLDKVSMKLNLSPGIEAVWRSFPTKIRNHVRKAEKSGLRAYVGGGEWLDDFYPVFAANMRDLGSPVHHRSFFTRMFEEFGSQARLIVARDGQRTVGGLVCLFFKDTATVFWASSLREYFSRCPNNLLYWQALQYAFGRGCTRFDFGRSSIGSGTYDFKRQWGAEPTQIYWQVLSKDGRQDVALSSNESKYDVMREVWKHLPVSITTWLGPPIRKYITN